MYHKTTHNTHASKSNFCLLSFGSKAFHSEASLHFLPSPPPPPPTLARHRDPAAVLLRCSATLTTKQLHQLHALLITHPPPPSLIHPNLLALKLISAPSSTLLHSSLTFSSLLPLTTIPLILWNSLLKSFSQNSHFAPTLHYFNLLLQTHSPRFPDEFTFTSVVKACAGLFSPLDGDIAHAHLFKLGHQANIYVANSLIDMYFKFGQLDVANKLFDEMTVRDVVSYNTLVSGYASCGQVGIAREVFDGMGERSVVSWSAMMAGYVKMGDVGAARELFDRMPERNVVCWNAMIAGYSQNEKFAESIELFRRMLEDKNVRPNEVTLVSVLSACANLGALELGRWIEKYITRRAMELGVFLGNALSDMYAKCGCIADAQRVFDRMVERDVISWTIIVSGFAMHGLSEEAVVCFQEMLRNGIKPNDITFMGILSSCTHAGLVDEGLRYFNMMSGEFGIDPKVEHYGCVVDLLSRAGRLNEAENLIFSMRVPPNAIVWGALLGGCRTYGDIDRGERVAHQIIQLEPGHSGSYVYLANVYSSNGRLEEAAKYRVKMREKKVVKTPGCSWIEVHNVVYEFLMGDRSHPRSEEIYSMIGSLRSRMKLAGYVPNTSVVCQSIDEEEKQDALLMHSEKLAVAFGLISTKEGTMIRIVKNLRVCTDCHDYMKIISKIVSREIVLRDRNRFHHFKDGFCSCKDFW